MSLALESLHPTVPLSYATQILILRWGLSAREEIQPGDCFDIVGHSPGNTFMLSDQGCSRFRAIGSLVKTPHLITAVNMFEEPKMCHVCLKQNRFNLEENSCHFKQHRDKAATLQ